jgi:hypothetical protein
MHAVGQCIAHMQHADEYLDMYSKNFLKYLNRSFIFKEF